MPVNKDKLRALLKSTKAKAASASTAKQQACSSESQPDGRNVSALKPGIKRPASHAAADQDSTAHSKRRKHSDNNRVNNNSTKQGPSRASKTASGSANNTLDQLRSRLSGSHFRLLNEQLYTTDSQNAVKMFNENPALFEIYHTGFRHQVESWPLNPVDRIVALIRSWCCARCSGAATGSACKRARSASVPHLTSASVVLDLGCGEAKVAQTLCKRHCASSAGVSSASASAPFDLIRSFDLVEQTAEEKQSDTKDKGYPLIEHSDISHLPVPAAYASLSVFSLSLMGTNWPDFLREAWRVSVAGGWCVVAEVVSRFVAGDDKTAVQRPGKSTAGTAAGEGNKHKSDKERIKPGLNRFVSVCAELGWQEVKREIYDVFVVVLFRRVDKPDAPVGNGITNATANAEGKGAKQKSGAQSRKEKANSSLTAQDATEILKPCIYKRR